MDLSLPTLWHGLIWPLMRLLFFISAGLLIANLVEAMNWTRRIAVLARPLISFSHLSETAGASFSMAFLSGVSANTMLAEAFEQGRIDKRELILANLFNSLPTYFLHLPTTLCITAPLIKAAAFTYVGLTLGAGLVAPWAIWPLGWPGSWWARFPKNQGLLRSRAEIFPGNLDFPGGALGNGTLGNAGFHRRGKWRYRIGAGL